jgi:hypothetical protein
MGLKARSVGLQSILNLQHPPTNCFQCSTSFVIDVALSVTPTALFEMVSKQVARYLWCTTAALCVLKAFLHNPLFILVEVQCVEQLASPEAWLTQAISKMAEAA